MKKIYQIFIFQFIFFILSCHAQIAQKDYKISHLSTETGEKIKVEIVYSYEAQNKGLSGRKNDSMKENEGMLFIYKEAGPRRFWMPDTYIDLDIFFLTKDLKVIDVARNMKAHPGMKEPPAIQRTPVIHAMHVLELRADSNISKKIKKGMTLKLLD